MHGDDLFRQQISRLDEVQNLSTTMALVRSDDCNGSWWRCGGFGVPVRSDQFDVWIAHTGPRHLYASCTYPSYCWLDSRSCPKFTRPYVLHFFSISLAVLQIRPGCTSMTTYCSCMQLRASVVCQYTTITTSRGPKKLEVRPDPTRFKRACERYAIEEGVKISGANMMWQSRD